MLESISVFEVDALREHRLRDIPIGQAHVTLLNNGEDRNQK